jgi:uncharacterized membrane protein
MAQPGKQRLGHIDWMRGLACVVMFQTHCYDSWLSPQARSGSLYRWSQLLGTLPAPLFLFLAGISVTLVIGRLEQRGVPPKEIAGRTIRRGGEILLYGFLFRLQEFLLGLPGAPWTDLLRVDILNEIGVSIMLLGALYRLAKTQARTEAGAAAMAAAIPLATPLLWTSWAPRWLPWPLESYLNGVHTYATPRTWLFPIFPWAAFAFAGMATGFALAGARGRRAGGWTFLAVGLAGGAMIALGFWFDALPVHFYAVYDFWHTSPNFFLIRLGVLLEILFLTYAWCRWGLAQKGFSPIIQLGLTSLMVYWVHIEFVYGRFSILPKRASSIPAASLGLASIFVAMVLLSLAWPRVKGKGSEVWGAFRRLARLPGTASPG